MRVRSKLADVEFQFGEFEYKKDHLIIHSAQEQAMQTRVYVSPDDIVSALIKAHCPIPGSGCTLSVSRFSWFATGAAGRAKSQESRIFGRVYSMLNQRPLSNLTVFLL